ncbi:MAG: hypothetical protein IJM59_13125 [Proteobacteria bacterium]|jgi:hypothetical protein|nr:hypothetical protein [Pseudomonadota bacterium]
MARDDEERELEGGMDDDSFDEPALESELEADLIEEWCPICRDIKPHAIVKGDKIACASCNHEHLRESEGTGGPVVKSLLTADDQASSENLANAWKRLTDVETDSIRSYSIRLKLLKGDVIRHPKFGLGIVVEMTDSTKAEVLFEDGLRRLVCGK